MKRLALVIGLAVASTAGAVRAEGVDFSSDAALLYRIAACGGEASVDAKLEKVVERHCKFMAQHEAEFRKTYIEKGHTWFEAVVPKDAPKTVVYPFGGGDLLSALVAFPDATEITTISLERAGDPRRLKNLTANQLEQSLGALRAQIGGLISVGSNTSENLSAQQKNDLPGQVSSFLIGLVTAGYEPVAMRFFTLDAAGKIHYLEQAEIDAIDKAATEHKTRALKGDWQSPSFSEAFTNVEIQYKRRGEATIRTHRHIGWNLGDDYMKKHPELVMHLAAKGKVTMLVKGASYLLWSPNFGAIRGYILDNLAWMLSDSTGVPPRFAKKAGMVQETYGYYNGAFLEGSQETQHDADFIALWQSQPRRKLPFRFGYVDKDKQAHLVVTRPKA